MSSPQQTLSLKDLPLGEWWPIGLAFAILYVPTYLELANGPWTQPEYAHGPIVLAMALWLFWRGRTVLAASAHRTRPWLGAIVLAFGLLLYAIGRSQQILILEVGSQIPVLAGALLLLSGGAALRRIWFPILFIVFLVPLPSFILDMLTLPLKHYVSMLVDDVLYFAGYPIARSGVVITIGEYQLLVADACSGLHSMYSLSAVGLFYMHMRGHASAIRNGFLLASILPIAFLANIGRVIALVLITYYLGDEAGQGFLHDFAGILEFVLAVVSLIVLDGLLGAIGARVSRRRM